MKLHEIIQVNEDIQKSVLYEVCMPYLKSLKTYYENLFDNKVIVMVTSITNATCYVKLNAKTMKKIEPKYNIPYYFKTAYHNAPRTFEEVTQHYKEHGCFPFLTPKDELDTLYEFGIERIYFRWV